MFPFTRPVFQPAMRVISSITQSNPAVVTTTIDHLYITGTIVRIDLPITSGMQQLNQQFGPILVTGTTTFTIPIDTTLYDTFIYSASSSQQAQSVPIGEISDILTAAVQNVLPYPAS